MSNIVIHREIEPSEVHAPYSYRFSTSIERESIGPLTNNDIGKLAIQLDDMSIWLLTSSAPSWRRVLLEGNSSLPSGPAGGDLQGLYPSPSVVHDSHLHTPGVSIPTYPVTLPPSGPASGDLVGLYPSPQLSPSGVVAGLYTNPSIRVDGKGRITQASSNPIGEANSAINLGSGTGLYTGKSNTTLQLRSIYVGEGLTITTTPSDLTINTPGLAKLSGAEFTGPVIAPSIRSRSIRCEGPIYSPLYDAGSGSAWSPDARNGKTQMRALTSSGIMSNIIFGEPGMEFTFYLRQPSSGSPAIMAFSPEYRFPRGESRTLSTSPSATDVLEVKIISNGFYYCRLYNQLS